MVGWAAKIKDDSPPFNQACRDFRHPEGAEDGGMAALGSTVRSVLDALASHSLKAARTSSRKRPSSVTSVMPSPNLGDSAAQGDFFEKATNNSCESNSGSSGWILSLSASRANSDVAG
ncbi:hypothetical protein AUC71_00600 [Methyloceanibacter marginalis]|uniref:Uncharacterized protein n=1 Tax=Methyloceanibacter marginalis TaxID=1774971 RepID=A0A1E3WDC2_9HYPH|nr:hypothetical protein AUC71_00600 [Methyloceanibacter marginalis]